MDTNLMRLHMAAQIMGSLITLDGFTNEQAIELAIKLADSLIEKSSFTPDPSWDYFTLWGILTTAEVKIKALKKNLSELDLDPGDRDTNDFMYGDLMGILQLVDAGLKEVSSRGINEKV